MSALSTTTLGGGRPQEHKREKYENPSQRQAYSLRKKRQKLIRQLAEVNTEIRIKAYIDSTCFSINRRFSVIKEALESVSEAEWFELSGIRHKLDKRLIRLHIDCAAVEFKQRIYDEELKKLL